MDQESQQPPSDPQPDPPSSAKTDPKVVAIVSYLTLIGWIVALIMNQPKQALASFHIRQMLGLMLLMVAIWIVGGIITMLPVLGMLLGPLIYLVGSFGVLVLWIMGLVGAVQGSTTPMPLIGDKFQEWFSGL